MVMVSNSINDFHQDYLSALLEKDSVLILRQMAFQICCTLK